LAARRWLAAVWPESPSAQDDDSAASAPVKPRFVTLPPKPQAGIKPDVALPTWNGSFTYNGKNYTYNMVGTAPSSNASTTVPVYIVPIKITC